MCTYCDLRISIKTKYVFQKIVLILKCKIFAIALIWSDFALAEEYRWTVPKGFDDRWSRANLTLVFEDDFSGNKLDLSKWTPEAGSPSHISSSRWPQNLKVYGGLLELITRKEMRGGKQWTTAHVKTKREFGHGVFEARIRFANAAGMNNAFWLFPNRHPYSHHADDVLVSDCEVDVVEATFPNVMTFNLHTYYPVKQSWRFNIAQAKIMPNFDEFMVFSVHRTNEWLTWRLDGRVVRILPSNCKGPLTLRLSTATADWLRITDEEKLDGASMKVDYIRVWNWNSIFH